jgi:5,10-methylene-tetrahydrofolate dehydrogenase/methenyl tetrahydrofolate cyclohydrolase
MFKQIWHPEMIENHIMQRHGQEPLNSYYYATHYPDVYAAAERIFGSWGDAIEACGLDYNTIRKYKSWTRQAVLDEIRKLAKNDEPLHSQNAQNNHKSLYMAAIKRYRNWGQAVQAAGIRYKDIRLRRSMTKSEIKKEILELFRRNEDLSYTNMRKNYQYLLAAGMKKLGNGSWARARKQCGILTNYRLNSEKRVEQK